MRFYFTYGDDPQYPFTYGWTEVDAKNINEACDVFRSRHPREDGLLNCAFVYDEEKFKKSPMYRNGNCGIFAHERISLNVESLDAEVQDVY